MKWCDLKCKHASFPRQDGIDGAGSCRTFSALWCNKLKRLVPKNSVCMAEKEKQN